MSVKTNAVKREILKKGLENGHKEATQVPAEMKKNTRENDFKRVVCEELLRCRNGEKSKVISQAFSQVSRVISQEEQETMPRQ